MALFPQSFIDEVRQQADILRVVQDHVALKRAGTSYKGLCPFHSEKTPSFHVHPDKGFFHCFGCGVGGDVFKFVELQERVGFTDAARLLAQRFGVPIPDAGSDDERSATAHRETLLKVHEEAAAWFREQLDTPAGARARQQLNERRVEPATVEHLGIGYAPPGRDGLTSALRKRGFSLDLLLASGLIVRRESGEVVDRFRNRLMIPIARESGSVVAFGGRAMEHDQVPKYLNSPETAIYVKGRTLYGLNLTKQAIRQTNYAILVEGYFDFAQLVQAGIGPVVASCGTALTSAQAQLLRRFTSKIVLSFDPDAAGEGAAVRSCELLVGEGFTVNVAVLPAGQDPDAFVRTQGRDAYQELLRRSQPYLEFLLDRAARRADLGSDEGRRGFLQEMLGVAARIPDAAVRDQFADRLAHKARITEEVIRSEIRKAAVARRTEVTERVAPARMALKPAERGLIWALVHEPSHAMGALDGLDPGDLDGLAGRRILELARSLQPCPPERVPSALLERLSEGEVRLVTAIAADPVAPGHPDECARTLRLLRYDRERAALQQEIDRLERQPGPGTADRIAELGLMKVDLKRRVEALNNEHW